MRISTEGSSNSESGKLERANPEKYEKSANIANKIEAGSLYKFK